MGLGKEDWSQVMQMAFHYKAIQKKYLFTVLKPLDLQSINLKPPNQSQFA